jgi:hypothetical protein
MIWINFGVRLSAREREMHAMNRSFSEGRNPETKLAAQPKHGIVLGKDIARDRPISLSLTIADRELHQARAKPTALEVGSHQDGEFRRPVIGIRVKPHYAQNFARSIIKSHEGDGPAIVELREPGHEVVIEVSQGCEESEADVPWIDLFEKG